MQRDEKRRALRNELVLQSIVPKRETLSDYVRLKLIQNELTTREVQERSNSGGEKITQSYVSQIVSGTAKNLTLTKLRALARGLGVPIEEVISRAYGETYQDDLAFAESRFADVYYKFEELSDEHKQNVLYLLDILEREVERLRKKERTKKRKG
ncbi:MAG: helix-turn-helix domain-containing protein [Acidobacteria bacterium]|nr:helix-turn-helix domain-containing protein [Acidobacteriota bacterium]